MRFLNWLWSLLPDKCENPLCHGQGVRGNENVIEIHPCGDTVILCDDCHVWYREGVPKI
jgi:hypothetical protein